MSNTTTRTVDATATLTIEWSEASHLERMAGQALPLGYGTALLEAEHVRELIERAGRGGCTKTGFLIQFTHNGEQGTWQGRYDLGCDTPTLAEHISGFAKHARPMLRCFGRTEEQLDEMQRDADHIVRCIEAQRLGRDYYLA
ncbi:MAG: LPD25 domain-containing protein [Dermabacteraceae bacterium]